MKFQEGQYMLDREKLLKFLNANLAVNQLSQAGLALSHVIKEIDSGKFDVKKEEAE